MMETIVRPDLNEELDISQQGPWIVILYNDDWHPYDQVVFQVQKATGCSLETAEMITMEAHLTGRAIAFASTEEECERAAGILRQIRLQVEVDRS